MCGISGVMLFDRARRVDAALLGRMTAVLAHRGPDDEGCYIDGNVGLGHRRLAVIDLATGSQPMVSPDGTLAVVFNGEIYNFVELRKELVSLGHAFRSSSDTEVILKAYAQWGPGCQERFNGMWAFALWDARRRQLLLSRDRLGEKPLYYSIRGGSLLFGSEIKSILQSGFHYDRATELTHLYLSLGYVPAPFTFYSGISKLKPGHYVLACDGGVREYVHWDLPRITEHDMRTDGAAICEQFGAIFGDSVRLRMRSDVPYGAFLSGGLDSSSVVAAMAEESQRPIETFTIGFGEKTFDERLLARSVAQRFRTVHREELAAPEAFDESLDTVRRHFDEPFGDASAIPVGMVSRLARQNVTMVLTGDGGDEVLSGYTSYVAERLIERYRAVPGFFRALVCRASSAAALVARRRLRYRLNRLKRFVDLSTRTGDERLVTKLSPLDGRRLRSLIPDSSRQIAVEDYLTDVFKVCHFTDPFYRLMFFNLKVSLPDDMLAKVDRMSMAHSLEARVPFLDHRLVELTYRVHKNVKMPKLLPKALLRNTYARGLPAPLLSAPKMPFSVPLREWFRRDPFDSRLADLQNTDFGLDRSVIRELVAANNAGQQDYGDFIWRLFVLKQWVHG